MQYSRFPGEMSRGNKVKIRVSRVQGTRALTYIYILCILCIGKAGPSSIIVRPKQTLKSHATKQENV